MEAESEKVIKISVRNLVEFVLRSGDLDNRRLGSADREAMQKGGKIHRRIQKSMGPGYHAEVGLKHKVSRGRFELLIEGRADGIMEEADGTVVDEIKGMYVDLNQLEGPFQIHEAQAKCYGYFYCFDHGLASIDIQMTYCNLETEEVRRFRSRYTFGELKVWFDGIIDYYAKWAEYQLRHARVRDRSIRDLEFPYPYRKGQKELASSVYRAVRQGVNLFVQAPTGVGKTLSTVYPGLKAFGEGYLDKLFYLTAKTAARSAAVQTFQILQESGLIFSAVAVTAKEKACILDKPNCNPEACPFAKGHFDRVNEAVFAIIHRELLITRDVAAAYAETYRVCPFEFCLDITGWADGILCDYNYVFDPNARLKRYFSEGEKGDYLFLVDEAHNLVPRAREMYSAQIRKEDILLIKKTVKNHFPALVRHLDRCNRLMLEWKRECEKYRLLPDVNMFFAAVLKLFDEVEKVLEGNPEFTERELVLDFYFGLRDLINTYERLDENYRIYTELLPDGTFLLRLFCVDPSSNLKECLDKGRTTVFFSATLLPIIYYKELLSKNREEWAVYTPSPFDARKRLLLIASDVSSRYTRRHRGEYEKVAGYIRQIAAAKTGNYMAFFPSYRYMREVAALLEENGAFGGEFTYRLQDSGMGERQREEFLEEFNISRNVSFVAFCVMGGMFSEGIDLREERLIGAIIVGTGLPMVCTEQEILKNYFEERESMGFDYAYRYPGMNKVMQAAGRVIRTAEDRGIIALLDDRFLQAEYQALFPIEWDGYYHVNLNSVGDAARSFWRESDEVLRSARTAKDP